MLLSLTTCAATTGMHAQLRQPGVFMLTFKGTQLLQLSAKCIDQSLEQAAHTSGSWGTETG